MRRQLAGSVVVLVGATSGMGYATAKGFAHAGARLVLVGHDESRVDAVVAECRAAGATVVGAAIDVADAAAIDRVVALAVGEFGGIDTWINCAAALIAGPLDAASPEELKRLVDTNVLGTLLASRAALARFDEQGHGVLVNVASLLAMIPNPQVPAYVMSKYAIQGLTLSLRQFVWRTRSIRVCVVLPGPVDTPIFERAGNHTGRQLRAIPPAVSPVRAAATIIACARRPRRQVIVGWTGRMLAISHRLAPVTTEWGAAHASAWLLLRRQPAAQTSGGLFAWPDPPTEFGGWRLGAARRRAGDAVGRARIRFHSSRGRTTGA